MIIQQESYYIIFTVKIVINTSVPIYQGKQIQALFDTLISQKT